MKYFQVKSSKIVGSSYSEIYKKAWNIYLEERRKSKRRVYIRAIYFKKEKIFLDIFWSHLKQKHKTDKERRLRFYLCALELLKNSRLEPDLIYREMDVMLYRFYGITKDGDKFIVQIKKDSGKNKYLMSIFPKK